MKLAGSFALAGLLCCGAIHAGDCPPLAIYAKIPLAQVEGWNAELVPVQIAGVPKLMLLDTGAYFSTLKPETVNELQLKAAPATIKLYGLTGNKSESFVSTAFGIGGMHGNGIQFMVDDMNWGDKQAVGLLGASILTNYDLSIDFGAHRLDLISPNHCDGNVVYWPERPITEIPFKLKDRWKIILPVTLDGKEVMAQLDTGASRSTLLKDKAERSYNVVVGSADTPVAGNLNGEEGVTTWKHQFKSLSLAGIEVANPVISIIPDKMSDKLNTWSTGNLLDRKAHDDNDPPMLLGMNVLRSLHIYIAYREKKLYITPASKPQETSTAK